MLDALAFPYIISRCGITFFVEKQSGNSEGKYSFKIKFFNINIIISQPLFESLLLYHYIHFRFLSISFAVGTST